MGTWEQPPLLPHACIFSPVPRGFFLPILYLHSLLTLTSQLPAPAGPLPQPAPSHTVSAASLLSPIQALLATKEHFLNTNLLAISSTYPPPPFFFAGTQGPLQPDHSPLFQSCPISFLCICTKAMAILLSNHISYGQPFFLYFPLCLE